MKYIFRGRVILEFDPVTKQVEAPVGKDIDIPNFNFCTFIQEDYINLAMYFDTINDFMNDKVKQEDLKDIEVD